MQIRTRIKITTPVNNVGYELMSKLTNGRSLIYFRERGVEVNNVLQPFRTNVRWDNSRYPLDWGAASMTPRSRQLREVLYGCKALTGTFRYPLHRNVKLGLALRPAL